MRKPGWKGSAQYQCSVFSVGEARANGGLRWTAKRGKKRYMKSAVLPLAAIVSGFLAASPASHADISAISIRVEASSQSAPGIPDR